VRSRLCFNSTRNSRRSEIISHFWSGTGPVRLIVKPTNLRTGEINNHPLHSAFESTLNSLSYRIESSTGQIMVLDWTIRGKPNHRLVQLIYCCCLKLHVIWTGDGHPEKFWLLASGITQVIQLTDIAYCVCYSRGWCNSHKSRSTRYGQNGEWLYVVRRQHEFQFYFVNISHSCTLIMLYCIFLNCSKTVFLSYWFSKTDWQTENCYKNTPCYPMRGFNSNVYSNISFSCVTVGIHWLRNSICYENIFRNIWPCAKKLLTAILYIYNSYYVFIWSHSLQN